MKKMVAGSVRARSRPGWWKNQHDDLATKSNDRNKRGEKNSESEYSIVPE